MQTIAKSQVSDTQRNRGTTASLYAGFILTGVVTTLLGPLIPLFSVKWSIGDEKAGYLFTAQFIGSLFGVLVTSRAFARFGLLRIIAVSFFFMSAGICALAVAPWPFALCAVSVYGVGLGAAIPGINLFVAGSTPSRKAAALNTLNFVWGIGAVAGPPVIAMLARSQGALYPMIALGILLVLSGLLLLSQPGSDFGRDACDRPQLVRAFGYTPALLVGVFAFLYVGTENAVGGWIASYAERLSAWPGYSWALATALFWGALLVGRGIAPTMLRYVAQEKLVIGGLVCAIVGNLLLLLASRAAPGVLLTAGIAAEGIGFSVIYPITVAALSEFYQEAAPRFSAGVFSMAALGGACVPWLVGFVSSKVGGLRVGFLVPLAASIAMIGIRIPIMLLYSRADSGQPSAKVTDFPSIRD